jgi:hypothetical protein
MKVDWNVAATIVSPVIGLFVGIWANRRFEDRPKLVTFYGHVSAFKLRPNGSTVYDIFTHAVVIRNTGRRLAKNVRVLHQFLPNDITVFPDVQYTIEVLPNGGRQIVFPILLPAEQLTISYVYFPPVTYAQVTTGVRSDEGFAKAVNAIPSVPDPKWLRTLVLGLAVVGATALGYLAVTAVIHRLS